MPAFDFSGYSTKNYSSPTTSNNNGDNRRENYRNTPAAKASAKKAAAISARNKIKQDMVDFTNYSYTPPTGLAKFSPIAQVIDKTGLGKKSFEVNKSYYEKNLIGKTNLATGKAYGASVDDYKSYMSARGSGSIDAMGREVVGGNGGGGQLVKKNIGGNTILTTAPTTAEVSQSEAANADAAALKVKKRGRSASIMTGSKGVTKTSTDYSLGMKSLLGRV